MAGEIVSLPSFSIRRYQDTDRDRLAALWDACNLRTPWNDIDEDLALAATTTSAALFVGELDGLLCASCLVGHDGHRGWLYYLATDPAHQGKGLGSRMVRHCEQWLIDQGVPKVQLMIRETNLGARAFYRKLGYGPNPCHLMQRWLIDRGAPHVVPGGRPDGKIELTITYLAMTAPPTLPPAHPPRGAKVALLRARQPTVAFYRFLYDGVGAPWLWWERRTMGDDDLAAVIQDERVEIYVLYVEGVPAGYAELDRRREPIIDLAYFGLLPDFIGRRLGPYLLSAAIKTAWSYKPECVTVNTNTLDHPKALPLYQRYGFKPLRREHLEIDDPRVTGVIPLTAAHSETR